MLKGAQKHFQFEPFLSEKCLLAFLHHKNKIFVLLHAPDPATKGDVQHNFHKLKKSEMDPSFSLKSETRKIKKLLRYYSPSLGLPFSWPGFMLTWGQTPLLFSLHGSPSLLSF